MKDLTVILISVFMGAIGQVTLKLGANKVGDLRFSLGTIVQDIWNIVKTPEIIVGLFFFVSSFLLWIKVLTKKDLSYAYPMVSLGYVIVAAASFLLFKEALTANKLIGISLIIVGVLVLNR